MGIGEYFKTQFEAEKFKLYHENASDFCLSCWQKNRASLPLLCVRAAVFLGCVAILIASLVITAATMSIGYWFIFMTHWGLLMITLASGFAVAVSYRAYTKGPIDATFGLPWYVQTFWALYDAAIPMAFFITVYYHALLTDVIGVELDPVLDFFIHTMNSILMFVLLMTSRHPSRPLHFYFVLAIGLVYIVFTGIYHAAGGTDPFGNPYIYPTLDWSDPGTTMLMVLISAVALIVMHCVVVGLALLRNILTRSIRRNSRTLSISREF